jgi:hypothetical protein
MLRDTPYTHVYAFDPGDDTGIAQVHYGPGPGCSIEVSTVTQEALFRRLFLAPSEGVSAAVYERFVQRSTSVSRTQKASECVGAIKMWGQTRGIELLTISPSETHRLKRESMAAGWKWKTEHELDAIRILIYGLTVLRHR